MFKKILFLNRFEWSQDFTSVILSPFPSIWAACLRCPGASAYKEQAEMVSAPRETKTDIRQEAKVAWKWSSFGIYCGSTVFTHTELMLKLFGTEV